MKRIFTLFFLIPNLFLHVLSPREHVAFSISAQTNNLELYPKIQSFITPSPQAAAIIRYGDYPVNYNTGLVDMRIPVYNIKSGSLSLPIDISFHASGRMANETNGVLGMRWVFNIGGIVTRTVRGYADEWNYLAPYTVNPSQTPNYDELRRSCVQGFIPWENDNPSYTRSDSELDVFNYVLPTGKSGQFVLKNENGIKVPVQIPYEALKIELMRDNSHNGYYGSVNITDVDGTTYSYGDGNNLNSKFSEYNHENPVEMPQGVPTGWYLKSITSADKKDSIQFDYQVSYTYKIESRESVVTSDRIRDYSVHDDFDPNDAYGPYLINDYLFGLPRESQYGSTSSMSVPLITSVKFKDGELNCIYSEQNGNLVLENITIDGSINRKFKFIQEIASTEKDLRYLKYLEILSVVNGIEKPEEKYSFDYYYPSSIHPSYPVTLSADKKDWWGYYNATVNNLLPYQSVDFIRMEGSYSHTLNRYIGSSVTRDPDLESMKLGMLKSITYPTGGKTEFEYENNYYKEQVAPSIIKTGPGLRIKKITNLPVVGHTMTKVYKYGENENKTGYTNTTLRPDKNTVQEGSMMIHWDFLAGSNGGDPVPRSEKLGYRTRTYSSDPLINPGDFGGNINWYNMVTEYTEEDNYSNGEPYNKGDNGKTIYYYTPKVFNTKQFEIIDREYNIDYPKVFADPYTLWQGGKLLYKTLYKKENGSFVKTYEERYNYIEINREEVWDMPTYRHVNFSVDVDNHPFVYTRFLYDAEKDYHDNTCSVYGYGYRKYISGSEKLDNKTIEYFDGNGIASTTEYFYDIQYDQLRKEVLTRSDGKKNRIEYEYPFDKTTVPSGVYNKMVTQNILSPPVSTSQYVVNGTNNVFIQSKRTEFYEPSANVIRPQTEYFKKGSSTEEAIISYNKYDDHGNPEEISQANGMHVVYIWGYDKTQPIAKIENATYITGKSNTITSSQQNLINDAVSASINETTALTESNLLAKLQLLRVGFPDAMVSTYTYDPMIGITSMTDAKNYTIYYKYDSFSRLKEVKDNEGKILSANSYHYKGQ